MKWRLLIFLSMTIAGCSGQYPVTDTGISWRPPANFHEKDLIGVWESLQYDVRETITIKDDNTFAQDFADNSGRFHFEGKLRIENRPSSCVFIHLQGGQFFYTDPVIRQNGNRYPSDLKPVRFWDVCEGSQIEMPDEVILIVGSDPSFPRNIKLVHMRGGEDVYNQVLRLNIDNP